MNTVTQIATLSRFATARGSRVVTLTEAVSFTKSVGFFANRREVTVTIPVGIYECQDDFYTAGRTLLVSSLSDDSLSFVAPAGLI